jgi:hypothetical protein
MSLDNKFLIIAGGGKFGKIALDFAMKNKFKTVLIDINPDCFCAKYTDKTLYDIDELKIKELLPRKSYFLNQDMEIIYDLIPILNPEYIIPVVPIHLMATLVISLLNENSINLKSNKKLAEYLIINGNQDLMLSHNAEQGVIYFSHAKLEEICPDSCAGPLNYCPNFKREKDVTITQYLKDFYSTNEIFKIESTDIVNITIIIESRQLKAGLGGLKGKEINKIFKKLKNNLEYLNTQKCNVFIATTCACHGVANFYKNY